MGRRTRNNSIAAPTRRPLKIFAIDPMRGRTFGNRARVDVPNEKLEKGPIGSRLAIIDFDGSTQQFYDAVDLDQPEVLIQGGLDPSESDPRFHQQMVYAVAARTLENFDRALGRRITMGPRNKPHLRLFPHAFCGANAYYSKEMNAILFGYFRADRVSPGENIPGQIVYTCLSHDVIAHEMTHKIVDRLRPLFLEPSNVDVLAFHEGFADIVALFQHFSIQEAVREQIAKSRSDLRTPQPLVELAGQFGYAIGAGKALRSALDKADPKLYAAATEPHARGSILVSAVFDGFSKAYSTRAASLIRLATDGTGVLRAGELHPDLVNKLSLEASRTAQRVLDMCIRAFDYLPPVDITFGDFLRALITADYELIPDDELNLRSAMIEVFRQRGIYPSGVISLAEESLLWGSGSTLPPLPEEVMDLLPELLLLAVRDFEGIRPGDDSLSPEPSSKSRPNFTPEAVQFSEEQSDDADEGGVKEDLDVGSTIAPMLQRYAQQNAQQLGLSSNLKVQARGFHPVFRVAPNGRLVIELILQFAQMDKNRTEDLGGLPLRAGATLIVGIDGKVRYLIDKPMPGAGLSPEREKLAEARLSSQLAYVKLCDATDPSVPYMSEQERSVRMVRLASFARLHSGE